MEPAAETSPASLYPGGVMRHAHHFRLSAYWFGTSLLWGCLLIVIVPSQVKDLAPGHWAPVLGWLIGLGCVPGIVVPLLVGQLSDRCRSRWGRRRPYMAVGVAVNLVGLALLWLAGRDGLLWLYVVGYLVNNTGNNIATGSYSGIIPDVVPDAQHGEASGWMGAMSQSGTIVGVIVSGLLMRGGHVAAGYAFMAVALVLLLLVTVTGVRERPLTAPPPPLDLAGFLKRLWIDPRKYPNFGWVWFTRFLVTMGLWIVQEFVQGYLTDVVRVPESEKEITAAICLAISLSLATVTGLLGGKLSDRIGRKRVVYLANGVVAAACIAFIFSPSIGYVYLIMGVFGLAYGAYVSVDWALGLDVLPNREQDAAKDMAVWHMAMVLPQAFGPLAAGTILGRYVSGTTMADGQPVLHYAPQGYATIFILASAALILGAVLLRNVRGVK